MTLTRVRAYLMMSALAGALSLTACAGQEDLPGDDTAAPTDTAPISNAPDVNTATDHEAATSGAHEVQTPSCPNKRFNFSSDGDLTAGPDTGDGTTAASCPVDIYFHPNNGSHGGWIESWRLCYQGNGQYQICAGGYAPVRYWNPSSCGGSVQNYYPQGWHGWAQTGGGCC